MIQRCIKATDFYRTPSEAATAMNIIMGAMEDPFGWVLESSKIRSLPEYQGHKFYAEAVLIRTLDAPSPEEARDA